jgi:diguanylate cyclase (GGDEF)-like protein/PAS domain S-box-containing protein
MATAPGISAPSLAPMRRGRLSAVIWVYVGVVVGLFFLACFSVYLLSAVRAYVGGEGLWSKGQKDALHALARYTLGADELDYVAYRKALAVNQGDRQARIELEKAAPDFALAEAGLLQGRNHPDDVAGMVFLVHWFASLPELRHALSIWADADAHIDKLTQLGDAIHGAVQAGPLSPAQVTQFLQDLQTLNEEITPLEDDFSYTLGSAARKYSQVVVLTMLVVMLLMLALAYLYSRRMLRHFEMAQDLLHASEAQLQSVLQLAPIPIIIVRQADEKLLYLNDHGRQQFGIGGADLSAFKARDFYASSAGRDALIAAIQATGQVRDMEIQLKDRDGKPFWAWCSSQGVRYEGQDCVLTALLDVDERKRTHEELRYQAYHDALTGLPNRAMFMDAVKRSLHRLERSGGSGSLLFVDLDHFKAVNDELGHEMGDLLLQQVARRIQDCVREGDLVARLGGDEFVVLVEGPDDTHRMAEKILEVLRPDYPLGPHRVQVSASIGVSRFPDDGSELDVLLSAADSAMYQVKTSGRDGVQFYTRSE